jgi:hypothetical protein
MAASAETAATLAFDSDLQQKTTPVSTFSKLVLT